MISEATFDLLLAEAIHSRGLSGSDEAELQGFEVRSVPLIEVMFPQVGFRLMERASQTRVLVVAQLEN